MRLTLREVTQSAHHRLHRHPVLAPLNGRSLTRMDYIQALRALYGIHHAADRRLAAQWPDRVHRASLLKRDLAFLKADISGNAVADLPAVTEWASLLGLVKSQKPVAFRLAPVLLWHG